MGAVRSLRERQRTCFAIGARWSKRRWRPLRASVTVTVKTFSREDFSARRHRQSARCDIVANQLLNRVRHDAIERAKAEVKTAMAQLSARQASLEQFRNVRMQIDPLALARSLGETITTLRRDLIGVEVKLDTAKASLGSDAPQIKMLADKSANPFRSDRGARSQDHGRQSQFADRLRRACRI